MKICIVGNCQVHGLAACVQAMVPDAEVYPIPGGSSKAPTRNSDIIFLQTKISHLQYDQDHWRDVDPASFRLVPFFYYSAFHPDLIYAYADNAVLQSAMGDYNSALVLYGWLNNFSAAQTAQLFCEAVYHRLNYFDYTGPSRKYLIDAGIKCEIDTETLMTEWNKRGCFAHSVNHPKLFVLSSLARTALERSGIKIAVTHPEDFLHDALVESAVWPVYPEIAARLDLEGTLDFKLPNSLSRPGRAVDVLNLEEFVERSFARYSTIPKEKITVERFRNQRDLYQGLEALASRPRRRKSNPYRDLPEYCFWQKAVGEIHPSTLDPVVKPKYRVDRDAKISTAGSCFAQHIAQTLIREEYNYFVTEIAPPDMLPAAAASRGYGFFSARFGNIYTARQLLQLFQRAYGEFSPQDTAWLRRDGKFLDPFRPQIEPNGHGSADEVASARVEHFAAVREMFEQTELFVFTVGLTEAWRARSDGAVFPVAPGAVSDAVNNDHYEFVNFKVSEIAADLNDFISRIRSVNSQVRLLFTVSPVPLVATYERRHVLVSTTYSKSAIRAAVDEVSRLHDFVDYFPSYEIITGWYNKGSYFESDLRSVSEAGVAHVMRLFTSHYLQSEPRKAVRDHDRDISIEREIASAATIVCDEELLSDFAASPLRADRGAVPH